MNLIVSDESSTTLQTRSYPKVVGCGSLQEIPQSSGGTSPETVTFYDSEITESTSANTWKNWLAQPLSGATITNLNPEKGTLGADGVISRVANGAGYVEFRIGDAVTRRKFDCTLTMGGVSKVFEQYASGTVSEHLQLQVEALIASDVSKNQLNYYSTINHTAGTYARNGNSFARSLDLSSVSVGTSAASDSGYSTQRPGTRITDLHVLVANHFSPADQDYLRFVTPGGTVRTVRVIGSSPSFNDQRVLTLSAVATGCAVAKVGGNWLTQIIGGAHYAGGFVLSMDADRNTGVSLLGNPQFLIQNIADTTFEGVSVTGQKFITVFHAEVAQGLHPWFAENPEFSFNLVAGDSGSPCFAVVDGEPVVIAAWLTSSLGPCTWIGSGANEVLNKMIELADADAIARGRLEEPTGYTVTVAPDPTL